MSRWGGLWVLTTGVVSSLLALPTGAMAMAGAGQDFAPPSFYRASWSKGVVTLYWTDNSDNEAGFSLQTGGTNNWRQIGEVITHDEVGAGEQYTWADPTPLTPADGDRCYRVVLSYHTGGQTPGISETRCLSAPSPAPGSPSPVAQPTKTGATPRASAPTGRATAATSGPTVAPVGVGPVTSGRTGTGSASEPVHRVAEKPVPAAATSDTTTNRGLLVGAGTLVSSGLLAGGLVFWLRRRRMPSA
jgi:hypothetical protein